MIFSLFLLTLIACALVGVFLGQPFWIRMLRDTRGQLGMGIMDNALADRGEVGGQCGLVRLPTGNYPPYSTSIRFTTDANGEADFEFEAERDMLFIGMSATVPDGAPATATISMIYCNTKYLVQSAVQQWARCCDRKPVFWVSVREDKKLEFSIRGATPDSDGVVTLHGFQGKGCCG